MAITVIANSLALPFKRSAVEAAVRAGIGNRPGDWQVEILTNQERAGFQINILGSASEKWSRTFETIEETQPGHVQKIIETEYIWVGPHVEEPRDGRV